MSLALVNVAVVTRFLGPTEFGRLALLLLLAALLAIVLNIGLLQGTLMRAYGNTGEEEVEDKGRGVSPKDKRRALGTGLTVTAIAGSLAVLLAIPIAPRLAELLLGDASQSELVLLAVVAGALGALWRLLVTIPRMELRPVQYIVLNAVRPLLVIAAVATLLASGEGVGGVIAGTAVANLVSVVVAGAVTREHWQLGASRSELGLIMRKGRAYIVIVAAFWVTQNADLFVLSAYLSAADVGFYRLATRVAAVISFAFSAIFLAWGPLARTKVFRAAERDSEVGARSTLLTYVFLLAMTLLVAMAAGSDLLVKIAPPVYAEAAPLIPFTAGAVVAYALLLAVYRSAQFKRKRDFYALSAVGSAAIFVGLSPILIPWLGAPGAAIAVTVGFLAGTLMLGVLSQRGSTPLAIQWRRIGAGAAVAAVSLGAVALARNLEGIDRTLAHAGILLALPGLLVVTGALPLAGARSLLRITRESARPRPELLDPEALSVGAGNDAALLKSEQAPEGEDRLRYAFHHAPLAPRALVVSLSSSRPDTEERYAYAGPLRRMDSDALFLRSTIGMWIGPGRDLGIRKAAVAMVEQAREERGLPRARTVVCGSSHGGMIATRVAMQARAGHLIVGTPVVRLGDYLLDPGPRTEFRRWIAETIAGGTDDECRAWLNDSIPRALREAEGPTTVHLITSEQDEIFAEEAPLYIEAVESNPNLSLDLTMSDYRMHKGLRKAFSPFIAEKLNEILPDGDGDGDGDGREAGRPSLVATGRAKRTTAASKIGAVRSSETAYGDWLRYRIREATTAKPRGLIVACSTMLPDGTFQFVKHLNDFPDATVLFLRITNGHWLGFEREMEVRDAAATLIREVLEQRRVDPRDVVACGYGESGFPAVLLAAHGGLGHAIVGAPPVLLGEVLLGERPRLGEFGRRIARSIAGDDGPDARVFLDSIVPDAVAAAPGPTAIHLLAGERDGMRRLCVPPLERACADNEALTLEVAGDDYRGHNDLGPAYMLYLNRKLLELGFGAGGTDAGGRVRRMLRRPRGPRDGADAVELLDPAMVTPARSQADALAAESAHGEWVRYFLHDPPGAAPDRLLICFSSARPDTVGQYAFLRRLSRPDVATLFVRSLDGFFLGFDRRLVVRDATVELVHAVLAERAVPGEGAIACGTSQGAMMALIFGALCGLGNAVVGTPAMLGGQLLFDPAAPRPDYRRAIAEKVAGGTGEDARRFLDRVVSRPLERCSHQLAIHLLTSERDEVYDPHVIELMRICEAQPNLTLRTTLDSYPAHRALAKAYGAWVDSALEPLLGSSSDDDTGTLSAIVADLSAGTSVPAKTRSTP